jgi:hypothetical protein
VYLHFPISLTLKPHFRGSYTLPVWFLRAHVSLPHTSGLVSKAIVSLIVFLVYCPSGSAFQLDTHRAGQNKKWDERMGEKEEQEIRKEEGSNI